MQKYIFRRGWAFLGQIGSRMTSTGLHVKLGEGEYMKSSAPQTSVARAMMQHGVRNILGDVAIPSDRPFVICDYGAADGGASHDVIADIIETLRGQHPALPISVVNLDQPDADYISLFKLLNGELGKQSYKDRFSDVYVSAVGGNFYKQCLPNNSVHLALSTTSMHWMSKLPCKMTESITSGKYTCLADERKLFNQQMIEDFTDNLLHRAKEMVKGSYLVIAIPYALLDGHQLITVEKIWKSYAKNGLISQTEFLDTNFQCADMTQEEISHIFHDRSEVTAAGLQLVELSYLDFTCPFRPKLDSGEWSREQFAQAYVDVRKLVMYNTLYGALSTTRSHTERDAIVQQLRDDMADAVVADPASFPLEWKNHLIVIKKGIKTI